MTPLEEISQLYYGATPRSIERDLARAVELLKTMPDEEARERAAVYMDGLSQMRSEWAASKPTAPKPSGTSGAKAPVAGQPAKRPRSR
jgi:hypothetical protein